MCGKMFQINDCFFSNPEKGKPILIVDVRVIRHHHGSLPSVLFTKYQKRFNY